MKIALQHGQVILAEIEPLRHEQLKRIGLLRWNKTTRTMTGTISLDLLNSLSRIFTLPPFVEAERQHLLNIAGQVEQQREAPEPVALVKYPVKAQMFKHQVRGANMALLQLTSGSPEQGKGFAFLFEMGCGKTLTAIATMGALYQMHKVDRVLVVAPSSVCSVWPHDLQQFAAFPYHCETLLGEKKKRLEALDALEVWPFAQLKIAVINYESTHRDGIFEALQEYDPDLIICDESQRIKNHTAAQSKALHKLGDKAQYKLALSGTPVQNNAVDLYSQYRFLDPAVFGSNFYAFRNRYCLMGGYGQHQIVGYRNMDQLVQREHSIAYRVTKAECLDLPPQTFINRYVKFSPADRKLYEQLRRSSFAELDSGDSITATTVLTKMLRLILDYGDQAIIDEYAEVLARIRDLMGTHNGSHTAAVATVVLADQMLSRCIFGENAETARMEAQHMAVCITADLAEQEQPDVNEQAAQYISDWISTNNNYFTDTSTIGQRYGCIEDGTAFILPTILREALEKGGFSYRKTMNWLAEKQIVQIDPRGKYQIVKKFGGRPVRMIAADLELLQNPPDDEGFTEVLTDKDDIPF